MALYLRTMTKDAHVALEETRMARELMSPTLTLTTYRDILSVWCVAWAALESVLHTSALRNACLPLLPAARAQWVIKDLAALQPHLPREAVRPVYMAGAVAPIASAETEAELVGICYVAKGASLGAKVITRHLHNTLGLPLGVGTRFFGADAHDTMTWPQWMRELNLRTWSAEDKLAALKGATRAFEYLCLVFGTAEQVNITTVGTLNE